SARISTVSCLGGRSLMTIRYASWIVSLATTTASGSASPGATLSSRVGVRLGPGDVWQRPKASRAARGGQRGRPSLAEGSPDHVEAGVGGDAIQPGPKCGPPLETGAFL